MICPGCSQPVTSADDHVTFREPYDACNSLRRRAPITCHRGCFAAFEAEEDARRDRDRASLEAELAAAARRTGMTHRDALDAALRDD